MVDLKFEFYHVLKPNKSLDFFVFHQDAIENSVIKPILGGLAFCMNFICFIYYFSGINHFFDIVWMPVSLIPK